MSKPCAFLDFLFGKCSVGSPPPVVACGPNTRLEGGKCVVSSVGDFCGPNTTEEGGACVAEARVECGEGTTRKGDACVADILACGTGTLLGEEGTCVAQAVQTSVVYTRKGKHKWDDAAGNISKGCRLIGEKDLVENEAALRAFMKHNNVKKAWVNAVKDTEASDHSFRWARSNNPVTEPWKEGKPDNYNNLGEDNVVVNAEGETLLMNDVKKGNVKRHVIQACEVVPLDS